MGVRSTNITYTKWRAEALSKVHLTRLNNLSISKVRNNFLDLTVTNSVSRRKNHFKVEYIGISDISNFKLQTKLQRKSRLSNTEPLLLFVVDVTHDEIYYLWLNAPSKKHTHAISSNYSISTHREPKLKKLTRSVLQHEMERLF